MEIADICVELERLARSGSLAQSKADACVQAASLLARMREQIITSSGLPDKAGDTVSRLKWILVEQGKDKDTKRFVGRS
jgi:hypothetical protein